jgi:hypothetical protein
LSPTLPVKTNAQGGVITLFQAEKIYVTRCKAEKFATDETAHIRYRSRDLAYSVAVLESLSDMLLGTDNRGWDDLLLLSPVIHDKAAPSIVGDPNEFAVGLWRVVSASASGSLLEPIFSCGGAVTSVTLLTSARFPTRITEWQSYC